MSDVSAYGVHEHAAPGAVVAHTLVGTPIDVVTGNQVVGSRATFSTAPYRDPNPPPPPPPPKTRQQLHSSQRPPARRCAQMDCGNYAKGDTDYCRWHG